MYKNTIFLVNYNCILLNLLLKILAKSKILTIEERSNYSMPQQQLTHLELENLRHLIGSHDTASQKLQDYATQCTDPQVKQMLQQSAQSAQSTKQKLLTFLQ